MPLGREWTRRGDSASHRGRSRPKASARALQAPEAWSHTRKPHGKGTGEKAETWGVSAPRRPLCETGLLHLCGQPQAPGWGACPGRVGVSRRWADLHFAGSTATQDRGPTWAQMPTTPPNGQDIPPNLGLSLYETGRRAPPHGAVGGRRGAPPSPKPGLWPQRRQLSRAA